MERYTQSLWFLVISGLMQSLYNSQVPLMLETKPLILYVILYEKLYLICKVLFIPLLTFTPLSLLLSFPALHKPFYTKRLKVVCTSEGGRSTAYGPCRLKFFVIGTTEHLEENFLKVST